IPPTPRPRGRLSVLAFLAPAQRSRGGESAAVSSRADYDGGARRGARLTRLLARRERRCPARRGRRAGLARVEPTREFEPFVAAAASHAGSRSRARAASGSRVRRAGAAPSSISGRRTTRSEPLRWPPWPSHLVVALPPEGGSHNASAAGPTTAKLNLAQGIAFEASLDKACYTRSDSQNEVPRCPSATASSWQRSLPHLGSACMLTT